MPPLRPSIASTHSHTQSIKPLLSQADTERLAYTHIVFIYNNFDVTKVRPTQPNATNPCVPLLVKC